MPTIGNVIRPRKSTDAVPEEIESATVAEDLDVYPEDEGPRFEDTNQEVLRNEEQVLLGGQYKSLFKGTQKGRPLNR